MNKKGFTLIELIAVIVIMSIIAIIATPNIIKLLDTGKKDQYITDAKEFISKATYMYKQDKYKDKFKGDNNGNKRINLFDVKGIKSEDKTDPYGYDYDFVNSYIIFEEPDASDGNVIERKVRITLISHDNTNKCYTIYDIEKGELKTDSVKEGLYSNEKCTIS